MWRSLLCFLGLLLLSPLPLLAAPAESPVLVLNADGHTGKITRLCFSPTGKELITVSDDKTIRIWNVASGKTERVLHVPIGTGQDGWLYTLAISPDGQTLAVGGRGIPASQQGKIYLISLLTGEIKQILLGHKDIIYCLAFSPDGKWLASGSSDLTARLWELKSGRCKYILEDHTQLVRCLVFSPDSQKLATGSFDYTARIWSVATGESEAILRGHKKEIASIAWSPDGRMLATGGRDQVLRLWSAAGKRKASYSDMGDQVTSLSFTPDSSALLYTLGGDGTRTDCGILDLETDKDRVVFTRHDNTVSDSALSPDGRLAATAGGNNPQVYLWRTTDARVVHHLIGKGRTTWSAAWSVDGQLVAWGNRRDPARELSAMPLEHAFSLAELQPRGLASRQWTRNGARRGEISLQMTGLVTVAVRRGNELAATLELPRTDDVVTGYALLSENRAVVGSIFGLYLYDTRTGKLLRSFRGHSSIVWAMAESPSGRYLLSCSMDQTLRIWRMDQDLPLLSLFFAGEEWIAWTPEGYYAASLGGEQLIGWQVNNGTDRMAAFYPASQFRKKLYRPDVIKRMLGAGSLARALAEADAERGQKTQQTDVASILPPKVRITSPDRLHLDLKEESLEIGATAESVGGRAVTSVRLLLDGRPYQAEARATTVPVPHVGTVQAHWKVVLPPGRHRLAIQAASSVSMALSEIVDVTYLPRGETLSPEGNLYVLAIGVNTYGKGIPKLRGAAPDARQISQVLRDRGQKLFRHIESRLLVDHEATRETILRELHALRNRARPGDLVVVFYAGHGKNSEKENQFFLLPVDTQIEDLAATGISGEELKRELGELPCNAMLILDACQSGSIIRPMDVDKLVREMRYEELLVVFCAAARDKAAIEVRGHGLFTRALVAGLGGMAAGKDGLVYVDSLPPYLRQEVVESSGNEQVPIIQIPSLIPAFPLARR